MINQYTTMQTPLQVPLCELWEIFRKTFSLNLWVTPTENGLLHKINQYTKLNLHFNPDFEKAWIFQMQPLTIAAQDEFLKKFNKFFRNSSCTAMEKTKNGVFLQFTYRLQTSLKKDPIEDVF